MINTDDTFDKVLNLLRLHGGFYIANFSYNALITYIFGYVHAITDLGNNDPLDGLKELVHLKFGAHCALHWTAILRQYFATDDKQAIELFFTFYEQLKNIKKTQGLDFLKNEYERIGHFKRKRKTNVNWPARSQEWTMSQNSPQPFDKL